MEAHAPLCLHPELAEQAAQLGARLQMRPDEAVAEGLALLELCWDLRDGGGLLVAAYGHRLVKLPERARPAGPTH